MPGRNVVLAFDVNETLLDLRALDDVFERVFGDRAPRSAWFQQMLQLSFVGGLTGESEQERPSSPGLAWFRVRWALSRISWSPTFASSSNASGDLGAPTAAASCLRQAELVAQPAGLPLALGLISGGAIL